MFWNQNKTAFWWEMVTNARKRYSDIDKNARSEQIYALLDDIESAGEDDIDNLMNGSDTGLKKKLNK